MTEFRTLVDLSSDAALAIDGDSRVVAWNERAEGLLGYAPSEVIGRPCSAVLQAIHPDGERLCSPECEGRHCFARHATFAAHDCLLGHKNGHWVRASISTLIPPTTADDAADSTVAIAFLRPIDQSASLAPRHERLQIFTFGRFGLASAGRDLPIDRWYRKHALTLLKILVTHRGEAVHREYLIECLWPDADERRGRERLKVTTYFLRQQLRAAGMDGDVIAVAGAAYALKPGAVWLDCETLERSFNEGRWLEQQGRSKDALRSFEQAERIYKGDYLSENPYADWCAAERERLREIYLDVLGHMIDGYLDGGDHERAAETCRLGIAREPYRESYHRALLISLVRLGQRDRAVAHYRRCRQVLKAELGVEPAPETERLYRQLVLDGGSGRSAASLRH